MIPLSQHENDVLGWAQEAVQEGTAFLVSQPGYENIEKSMKYIMGERKSAFRPSDLSNTTTNRFGKLALDLAATLTDIKPFWEYKTFNKRFDQQAMLGNKLATSWWMNRFIDLKFGDSVKHALVAGTGYPHIVYDSEIQDLNVIPEDPRDVLPIRPSSYITIQDCLGVLIRRERTVNYLKARYPDKANRIKADRESSAQGGQTRFKDLMQKLGLDKTSDFMNNVYASLGGRAHTDLKIPSTDLYTLYVKDERRNTLEDLGSNFMTGMPVYMGPWSERNGQRVPDASWSYIVQPREKLYPRKRLILFTKSVILHDGPSIYWHGLFPIPKLTLDPWPWTWLGKAPLWDMIPLQDSLDRNLRIVDDHNEKYARPDLIGDKNSMSKSSMKRINTRRAGLKLQTNPVAGKGIQIQYPNPLDPSVTWMIDFVIREMDEVSGARDASQFAKLGQIPSAETVEKMLEAMSPAVRMRSRTMETTLREFAQITLSNFFQFYTTAQRIAVLGPQGMTFEDFDYDPGSLIPDFIHEDDYDNQGVVTQAARERGPLSRTERAQHFLRFFSFHVAPGSLLAASEITRKMLYLQLARAGWIDLWTLGDVLGIPNMGEPPDGANTIMERLVEQQKMGLDMAVNPAGRKASGQKAPRMTIKES